MLDSPRVPTYRILVRDAARNRVAEVDDFDHFEAVLRFNAVSSWTLELPNDTDAADSLRLDGAGLIVERDGAVLLSGPVKRRDRRWDETEDVLEVSGRDDTVVLAERLAPPVPGGPPYTAFEFDVRTGAAETVMRQYVDLNAGPGAITVRRVPGLTLAADGARGTAVTGRARFTPLLELLQSLALAGGDLGFRVVQVGLNREFQVYAPADRTGTVVFSPDFGNLSGFDYAEAAAEGNYVYAGDRAEGTARVFVEGEDAASITRWGRIETFLDRRDTTNTTEIGQAISEELSQRASTVELSLSPTDVEGMRFLVDYGLGDKVTALIDGVALEQLVREVSVSLTADAGEVISPVVIGTPGLDLSTDLFARLAAAQRRIGRLERR